MNKPPQWIKIIIPTTPESKDAVGNFLFDHGSAGLEEADDLLIGYFPAEGMPERIRESLNAYLDGLRERGVPVGQASFRIFPEEDWNRRWKASFKPVRVTPRLVVKPPWEEIRSRADTVVIDIMPRMAFGTGTHQSTRLCLELLEAQKPFSSKVLDLGTGSGILAIAAAKMGASRVLGVDVEPDAVANAQENAGRNGVEPVVEIRLGSWDVLGEESFDLILANIDRTTIVEAVPRLRDRTAPEGQWILAGFLAEDRSVIEKALTASGIRILRVKQLDEWLGVLCRCG